MITPQLSRRRFIQSMAAMAGLAVVPLTPIVDGVTVIDLPVVPDAIEEPVAPSDKDNIWLHIDDQTYNLSSVNLRHELDVRDVEISMYQVKRISEAERMYLDYTVESNGFDKPYLSELLSGVDYPMFMRFSHQGNMLHLSGTVRPTYLNHTKTISTGTLQFIRDRIDGSLMNMRIAYLLDFV